MAAILKFYGLESEFAAENFFKSGKKIYMANSATKNLIQAAGMDKNIFHGGLRVFEPENKSVSEISYTPNSNGRNLFLPFMKKRAVKISRQEFEFLLSHADFAEMDFLSEKSRENVQEIVETSGLGPIKLISEDLEVLAFVGQTRIGLLLNSAERFHCQI